MSGLFDFAQKLYGLFGFEFYLQLSIRPEAYLGAIETWDAAEVVRPLVLWHVVCALLTINELNESASWTSIRKNLL